jgi:hypothetical protein
MVIRVWVERDTTAPFRARMTRTNDIERPDEIVSAAASAEEVCGIVHAWLDDYLREADVAQT